MSSCSKYSRQVVHSSGTLRKDFNIVNSTICSTATLIGIHVVVGGWKSHVFAIQNTKAAILSVVVTGSIAKVYRKI